MARQKKQQSVEEGAKLAEELIRAQAELRDKDKDESAQEDELPPVDDSTDGAVDVTVETEDEDFDFSKLDEDIDEPPEDKDLAHKFSVLQGKYNTETKRLSDLLSQTMAELQELKQKVSSGKSSDVLDSLDGDEDVDELKEKFPTIFNSLVALAKREAAKATKGTVDKVDAIVQQSETEKKKLYYSNLTKEVPLWEKINAHPAWFKWLAENDEFSGTTRQNLINVAFNRLDYTTTAKFFNAFIKEKGIKVKEKSTNDDDIAPDVTGTSVNRSNRPQKGEITRAYIAKFYEDKAQGRLVGTEAEIAKQEAAIFQAVREGKYKRK